MNGRRTLLATLSLAATLAAACGGRSELPLAVEVGGSTSVGPIDACAGVTCVGPPSACYAPTGTCKSGACSYDFADGASCDDGDPCTGSDACSQGTCKGTSALCPAQGSALQVSVGHSHACALTVDGEVWCWGYNHYGELGNGTFVDSRVPVRVARLPRAQFVSAGFFHTCAVAGKDVMCWGSNQSGQLGNDTNLDSAVPVAVGGLPQTGARNVSAGTAHSCALTQDQRVYCWGRNCCGEIGNDFASETLAAYPVQGLDFLAISVSAGQQFTCVNTANGSAECFGEGGSGQLGQGRKADSSAPVHVVGLDSMTTAISAGAGQHACALTLTGGVGCWGDNIYGQLGPGVPREGSTTPVDISGLGSGAAAISAGANQVCAILLADRSVVCWGDGDRGQLGNGSTKPSPLPVAVSGLGAGVIGISAGTLHTCAVTAARGIKCWGFNPYGELGDGTTRDSSVPVSVRGF